MSQNPNSDPRYNPYGPNPSNPNYPPTPETRYNNSRPPSGPNPGYNPPSNPSSGGNFYPNPPSNPGSGTPNSSYGPYGPAPVPPPPAPPSEFGSSVNPYNPHDPTIISQRPNFSTAYPPYTPQPQSSGGIPAYVPQPSGMSLPPVPQHTPPPQKSNSKVVLISVIALLIVVGGVLGFVFYHNYQAGIQNTQVTATAQQLNLQATAHVQAQATANAQATTVASTYPFSSRLLLSDPLVDNSKNMGWDNNKSSGCFFSGSAYHVVQATSGHYNTCSALKSDYNNFTFEVEMVIRSGGNTGSGGLIFRANENNDKYYRLSIDTTGSYFVLAIVDNTGTNGNARKLKDGTASSFSTGVGSTNTLAIVARGDQYSFYVNRQLVTSFTDGTYSHGQIGFDVDYGRSSTELLFTNAKIWQL